MLPRNGIPKNSEGLISPKGLPSATPGREALRAITML